MLEVLITIVILAFGILGLVGLQAKMQNAEMESYQRSQALMLLEDMAARVNAHRAVASTYDTTGLNPAFLGTGEGVTQPADCSSKAVGQARDWCEWSNALKGSSEQLSGSNIGATIGGRGCIESIAGSSPPSFRITVAWQGLQATASPSLTCAQGLYGSGLRRAIAKVVTVANLTPP